jgi:hypothetical protein
MAAGQFSHIIVDESHKMRTHTGDHASYEAEAVTRLVQRAPHATLLSGTPSITRPFDMYAQINALQPTLFASKTEFAFRHCQRRLVRIRGPRGSDARRWDHAGCERPRELAYVLQQDLYIRRLKKDVLPQLPSKRRTVRSPLPAPCQGPSVEFLLSNPDFNPDLVVLPRDMLECWNCGFQCVDFVMRFSMAPDPHQLSKV